MSETDYRRLPRKRVLVPGVRTRRDTLPPSKKRLAEARRKKLYWEANKARINFVRNLKSGLGRAARDAIAAYVEATRLAPDAVDRETQD